MRISQCERFAAPPTTVWRAVEDISTHPTWMRDAIEITLLTEEHGGIGAEFACLTKVGPFRNHDVLRVTEWETDAVMGIAHTGVVTGTGRFTLTPDGSGTRFCWEEVLRFPWWMGSAVGERIAKPVLGRVWRKNLRRLKAIVESR
ncbi:MAG: SRPBCC family protein [Acidimicrobiia bacterium]